MKKIPKIKSVMSPFPYWIDMDATLAEAENLLFEHKISHLPVKEHGEIVAVIAHSDIDHAKANSNDKDYIDRVKVGDICVKNPYIVGLEEPLDNVLLHLSNYHISSAIVVKENRLAGVFTESDACRLFATFLRDQFRNMDGDDIA